MDGLQQLLRTAKRLFAHQVSAWCDALSPLLLTVSENFDTASSETTVADPDEFVNFVAPVFGTLVEVCHPIDANLTSDIDQRS